MEDIELNTWRGTADYKHFYNGFIKKPGTHLLGIGMTGSGKTMKALVLAKWCLEAGKTVVWFDTEKPDDINYLLNISSKATVFHPPNCQVSIKGQGLDIKDVEIKNPAILFREIQPGLNIISLLPFFPEASPHVDYLSKIISGMIDDAFRKKLRIGPVQIFMDEFQEICPSKTLHYAKSHQYLAAKMSRGLFKLRSIGIGFCAFTQSYRNIFRPTRLQFSYYLVCKDPDGDLLDYIGKKLVRYSNLFAELTPEMSVLIHPNGKWNDIIRWPMPIKDNKIEVDYEGFITEQKGESIIMRIPIPLAGKVKELITSSVPLQSPSSPHSGS